MGVSLASKGLALLEFLSHGYVQSSQCPEEVDEETVGYYYRAWILHLFACVLFPDAMGDNAS